MKKGTGDRDQGTVKMKSCPRGLFPVPRLPSPVSCLLFPVSCLLFPVPRLPSPVSCLLLPGLRSVIDLPDLKIRVLIAAHLVPPAVDVVGEGTGADFAEAVELADILDFNDGTHAFIIWAELLAP